MQRRGVKKETKAGKRVRTPTVDSRRERFERRPTQRNALEKLDRKANLCFMRVDHCASTQMNTTSPPKNFNS